MSSHFFDRQILYLVFLFLFWGTTLSAQTAQSLPIRVEKGKTYSKQLFAFGRDIVVEGEVENNVGAIFGDVTIRGIVRGNVSVLNGSIAIDPGGQVTGNLVCVRGSIKVSEQSVATTRLITIFGPKNDRVQESAFLGSRAKLALFFFKMFLLFLSVILLAYAFPSQVREASFQLGQEPGNAALMGIVALTMFAIGLFFAFLLLVVAVGIPLFLLLGCAFIVFAVFGQVVVYFWMGQKIRTIVRQAWSPVFSIFAAVVIIGIVSEIPFLGVVIQILVSVFGIGIVLHTRFGTNREWFTRRARVWSAD